jgi:hypothetical protein
MRIIFLRTNMTAFHSVDVTGQCLAKEMERNGHEIIWWDRRLDIRTIKADAVFLRESDQLLYLINQYGYIKWQPEDNPLL